MTVALLVAVGAAEQGRSTVIFLTKEAVRRVFDGAATGGCEGCPTTVFSSVPDVPGRLCRVSSWRRMAALDNAEWCHTVCRTHGLQPEFDDDAWVSEVRTPPLSPDAVTLVPNASIPRLLTRIDTSAGCSVKDSFASLDLTPYGFRILFEAQWIVRPSHGQRHPERSDERWELVGDKGSLASWEEAWRGDDGPTDVVRSDLLEDDSVAIMGVRNGDRFIAGAVLHRSSAVVGISNLFADPAVGSGWSGCLTLAEELFPAATFVGYESGDALVAARSHGFEDAGPLRVWILESP